MNGIAPAHSGPPRWPSAEELRMVRAIAFLAISEAARHGAYRATFRGFCVQAARRCCACAGPGARLHVDLIIGLGTRIVERSVVGGCDAVGMEPKSQAEVISNE